MESKKGLSPAMRRLIIILCCLLILALSLALPVLKLNSTDIRRDYGMRAIALADGNTANAYIYVTESELTRYRKTTDFWITRSDDSDKVHRATLVQISNEPISKASLSEKFGHNPEFDKILPLEECYELQVSFDRTRYLWDADCEPGGVPCDPNEKDPYGFYEDKDPLDWITEDDIEYALCTVRCKGISIGSAYDHMFGKYSKPESYLDLNP